MRSWVWSGGINGCDPVEATDGCDLERSSRCGQVEALGLV